MLPELFHLADYGLTLNLMVNLITAGHHVITQSAAMAKQNPESRQKKTNLCRKTFNSRKKRRKAGIKASNTVREKVS